MAKTKISQYDATAANNTDIDSINIAEGMAPSNVNNAIRELMAHLKDMDAGTQALTSPQLTSADINGGTIDGATIGGASAGAGTFTNLTATGTTTLAGASTSADITFGDNDKAIFGAGSDLQIYHDGAASYVVDTGTGNLQLRGDNSVALRSYSTTDNYLVGNFNGSVDIYYDNALKLATTSTGIDVTGTVTADGLSVSTSDENVATFASTDTAARIVITDGTDTGYVNVSSGKVSLGQTLGLSASNLNITSTGAVGIGTTSPTAPLAVHSDAGIAIKIDGDTANTSRTLLFRSVGTGEGIVHTDGNMHFLQEDASRYMRFSTANTEAMRIDSSQNLVVGKATAGDTGAGVTIQGVGKISAVRDSGISAKFVRETLDGDIVEFVKDTAKVGSIGALGGDPYFAGTVKAIRIGSGGVYPTSNSGSLSDGTYDLGASSARFKDLYLSGGVYLGGTGAANKLDDYEFGTFTPTIEGDSTAGTTGYSSQIGRYVKIGDLVHFQIKVQWTSQTGSGGIRVGNLPFTQFFNGTSGSGTPVSVYAVGCSDLTFTGTQIYGFAVSNTNKIGLAQFSSAVGSSTIPMDTAAIIEITGSYYTTA